MDCFGHTVSSNASTLVKLLALDCVKILNRTLKSSLSGRNATQTSEFNLNNSGKDQDCAPKLPQDLKEARCAKSQKWPCTMCEVPTFFAKHGRHLRSAHSTNQAVSEIMQEPNSKLRNLYFIKLRYKMTHEYHGENNLDVTDPSQCVQSHTKHGGKKAKLTRGTCHLCYKVIALDHLQRHITQYCVEMKIRRIRGETENVTSKTERRQLSKQATLQSVSDPNLRYLLSSLSGADMVAVILKDEILKEYANFQAQKYVGGNTEVTGRQNVRNVVSFLLHCRANCPSLHSLSNILHPANYADLAECIQSFSGTDVDGKVCHPSKSKRIGELLQDVALSAHDTAIYTDDDTLTRNTNRWQELHKRRHAIVSRNARSVMKQRHFNSMGVFPHFSQIDKLNTYLDNFMTKWKYRETTEAYLEICHALLAKIILFNRKRQGEASKILVDDFVRSLKANTEKADPYVAKSMDDMARYLSERMFLLEFIAKGGQRGSVLLTQLMKERMQDVLRLRAKIVTVKSNQYLFARPGASKSHIVGGESLLREARRARVKDPHLFKSTFLRKHLATLAQSCHMAESEKSLLVAYMNHTDAVHSTYYEKKLTPVAKGTVAQILFRVNSEEMQGKSINPNDLSESFQIQFANAQNRRNAGKPAPQGYTR